jgi:uncharacterized protein (UPF0276 family)
MIENIPFLGVGLGFRNVFMPHIFLNKSEIDFLEIIADHYIDCSKEKRQELDLLRNNFTLIPHAIGLSLGSAEGLDSGYVKKLAALIAYIDPPYWSEHISFTQAGGYKIGHLTPLPFCMESVDAVCQNVRRVQERITTPLVLENITYMFTYPFSTLTEIEFLLAILEEANVGLLLDATNLYTNSVNHGYDPIHFLRQLPPQKVIQLHFTGGRYEKGQSSRLIDNHAHPTPPQVWELMREILALASPKAYVLERDTNFPPFSEILQELQMARDLYKSQALL